MVIALVSGLGLSGAQAQNTTHVSAWTTFNLPRLQVTAATCEATPEAAHYDVSYKPNTNSQFIQVTHR